MAVRAYLALSLDGFVAGPDHDLSWLEGWELPDTPGALSYAEFVRDVGVLLMGRGTFDVVRAFEPWPYDDLDVWVASFRPLDDSRVRQVRGGLAELVAEAREHAAGRDVYVDGGRLVYAALTEGLLDELVVTHLPIALGRGVPLFHGPIRLQVRSVAAYGEASQVRYAPA